MPVVKQHLMVFLLLCFLPISYSQAIESRVALVIGNKDYAKSPLDNPINDARDMKAALEQVGFRVIYRENANLSAMDDATHEFVKSLSNDSVGLVYYSGHGAQADDANYLIPIGANITSKAELKSRAYDAGIILNEMQAAGNKVNVVILDACRNNPFKGFRGGAEGLTSMSGPKGSLIAYATAPGSVASDGASGHNGVYTSYLKQYIVQPGLSIEEMFKKVLESVSQKNPDQTPWYNSSMTGSFCFAGCVTGSQSISLPTDLPAKIDLSAIELSFWESIKDSTDPEDFRAYLSKYANGQFIAIARNRLKTPVPIAVRPELTPAPITEQPDKAALSIGSPGPGGGIVFYIDGTGAHGLEAKTADEPNQMTWDAAMAANYGSGWRLPTKDESNQLYLQKTVVGGFADNGYWSSTEYNSSLAWGQYFANGNQGGGNKYATLPVRAVRAF